MSEGPPGGEPSALCSVRLNLGEALAGQNLADAPLVDAELRGDLVLQQIIRPREKLDLRRDFGGERGGVAAPQRFFPAPLWVGSATT